jgi:hypothetical protein
MSYATKEDLAKRLRREFSSADGETADLLLDLASVEVTAALGKGEEWEKEQQEEEATPPRVLRLVTLEVAARVMSNPQGVGAMREQLGAYSLSEDFRGMTEAAGIALTEREKLLVRRAVHGRTSGSPRTGSLATELEAEGRAS